MTRLDDLRAKLAASTGPDGKPKVGYAGRVAALNAAIQRAATPTNPVG